jgi:hypothetical protein
MPTANIEVISVGKQKQKNQYAIFEHFRSIYKHGLPPTITTVLRREINSGQRNTLRFDFIPNLKFASECIDTRNEGKELIQADNWPTLAKLLYVFQVSAPFFSS